MNESQRLSEEATENRLIQEEKERFREKILAALKPFRDVKLFAAEAATWQPIVRMKVRDFFSQEYGEEVTIDFEEDDPNAMTVRARNRPRGIRVAVDISAQH